MATPTGTPDNFDMRPQVETWKIVRRLTVWTLGLIVVFLVLMAIFVV